jgi:hypothetical protein
VAAAPRVRLPPAHSSSTTSSQSRFPKTSRGAVPAAPQRRAKPQFSGHDKADSRPRHPRVSPQLKRAETFVRTFGGSTLSEASLRQVLARPPFQLRSEDDVAAVLTVWHELQDTPPTAA